MATATETFRDRALQRPLATLLLCLGGLLTFRLVALELNATDLFFDEAQYWAWSVEPAFGYYSKPPLIAWIIRAATEVCGTSEFCIRLPSPLIHTATAVVLFGVGQRLYDTTVGVWAAITYAMLPGVSYSAGLISTDVPLLFFWALAIYALVWLLQTRSWAAAILLGVSLGLGLNAKYAMAYFLVCLAACFAVAPGTRWLLKDARVWVALALGILLIAPNLVWNAVNSFATFSHTADNANWGGRMGNPDRALEFFLAQFGVFGPILFGSLLVIATRAVRRGVTEADRMLLAFAVPILIIVTVQAFLSRAHANWAAPAYVAATVVVVATLVRSLDWGWLRASTAVHAAVIGALALGTTFAGAYTLPGAGDPLTRMLGWRALAEATRSELMRAKAAGDAYGAIITDDRIVTAELLYYLRDQPTTVLAWRDGPRIADHFELTRPYHAGAGDPVLLVSLGPRGAPKITGRFTKAQSIGPRSLPAGAGPPRALTFWRLEGFKGL